MIRVIGPKTLNKGSYIDTTSRSTTWSKGLSPFYLGPVPLYQTFMAENVENAWQYSKVYVEHADANQDPTSTYWAWAKSGWSKSRADRYPMGKGRIPLYSLWNGLKLNYIEARKQIYIPIYRDAVKNTEAFKKLQEIYQKQGRITLFDFDGYDYLLQQKTLKMVLDDPIQKMGHGFVLAMMLNYGANFKISEIV